MKIDGVKLQREIREKMYEQYKDVSLREAVALIQKDLVENGYGHLFEGADKTKLNEENQSEGSKSIPAK